MQIERKVAEGARGARLSQDMTRLNGPCVGCAGCRGLCAELIELLTLPEAVLERA